MKVLVITNQYQQAINRSLLNVFSAVDSLKVKCDVVVVGYQLSELSQYIASYAIVDSVFTLDSPLLEHIIVDNIAKQLAQVAKEYTHIFVAADDFGKNLLPQLAALADAVQISQVSCVLSPNRYEKFMYTGNVLAELKNDEAMQFISIRSSSFAEYTKRHETSATVSQLNYDSSNIVAGIRYLGVEYAHANDSALDLTHAKLVVTGGRSLLSKENFDNYIRRLAKILKAAVGATRAAVEDGLASNDCQVGQTGKTVAPDIYLAIGISGAVQHIMGMKNAKMVIAVNNDATAPIFDYADYGLVADLFNVVPQLIDKLANKE